MSNFLVCSLIKNLSFDAHIKYLCKRAGLKVHVLARINSCFYFRSKFFTDQFSGKIIGLISVEVPVL